MSLREIKSISQRTQRKQIVSSVAVLSELCLPAEQVLGQAGEKKIFTQRAQTCLPKRIGTQAGEAQWTQRKINRNAICSDKFLE
jgi:hypothetical protein